MEPSKETTAPTDGDVALPVKQPKRILHFSDGTVEEFSDDEPDGTEKIKSSHEIDESKMSWGPWMWHKASTTGNSMLAGCDYAGEYLASFLGITTPKFSYEIEQYKKALAEREAAAKQDSEAGNWTEVKQLNDVTEEVAMGTVTNQKEVNKY